METPPRDLNMALFRARMRRRRLDVAKRRTTDDILDEHEARLDTLEGTSKWHGFRLSVMWKVMGAVGLAVLGVGAAFALKQIGVVP